MQKSWVSAIDKVGGNAPNWPINEPQLPSWILQHLLSMVIQADYQVAQLLAEYSEGIILAVVAEIEKLSLLFQGKQIRAAALLTVISDQANLIFCFSRSGLSWHARKSLTHFAEAMQ